jgi:hypothetical protein
MIQDDCKSVCNALPNRFFRIRNLSSIRSTTRTFSTSLSSPGTKPSWHNSKRFRLRAPLEWIFAFGCQYPSRAFLTPKRSDALQLGQKPFSDDLLSLTISYRSQKRQKPLTADRSTTELRWIVSRLIEGRISCPHSIERQAVL